ncbi:MAG: RNA polymerase factor sigma-54 [Bdellovibrio sp.]|nr:RNA polymerase factor sigma-54 [Bdellovibrio sp.]
MALRQTMNLSQSLVITPQLQQAIKLLQMSRMELESAVRSELEENPILEEAELLKEEDIQRTKEAATEVEAPESGNDQNSQDPQKQDEFEWESYIEANQKPPQSGMAGSEEIMNYENVITASQTLHDHLYWQVKMNGFSEEEEMAADALIGAIDDDGYIKIPLEQIAAEENVDLGLLEDTLTLIHEFDPAGVGARDLKECLLVQAKHLEEDTHDLVSLINNHLKDLEKKNYEAIAKALGREVGDVIEMCKIIYAMDPKPGRAFLSSDTHYVTPDVYVYKVGDDYVVSLNEDGLPRLKISNFYKNMLKGGKTTGDKTQDYIQEKLRSAVWLIKSIHQRQRTIYKVAESIVKHQREFFEKGSEHLKPMVLRDIANDIGMHESTVSRVTTAKYVHTPQGIYELKYFFNSGISSSDGDSLASESVKIKIKDLVAKESPKNPLSDQKIVDLLKVEGIQIARRTVAKYRDVLKILPSSQRKKYF